MNKRCTKTARIIDGPHKNRVLHDIHPPPSTLILMDDNFCYHEYERVTPLHGIHRYRYQQRLGRPRWANIALATQQETDRQNCRGGAP